MIKLTRDIVRYAIKTIQEHGWTQGKLVSKDGKVCAMGALHKAQEHFKLGHDDFYLQPLKAVIPTRSFTTGCSVSNCIPCWNDEATTTKEAVLNAFNKCLETLEE